jgi:hypothetical protein
MYAIVLQGAIEDAERPRRRAVRHEETARVVGQVRGMGTSAAASTSCFREVAESGCVQLGDQQPARNSGADDSRFRKMITDAEARLATAGDRAVSPMSSRQCSP